MTLRKVEQYEWISEVSGGGSMQKFNRLEITPNECPLNPGGLDEAPMPSCWGYPFNKDPIICICKHNSGFLTTNIRKDGYLELYVDCKCEDDNWKDWGIEEFVLEEFKDEPPNYEEENNG